MLAPVVVALDGSPLSEQAIPRAVAMARRTGARLDLVHVVSPPYDPAGPHNVSPSDTQLDRELLNAARAQLRALAGQCGAGGLVVTHDVRVGPVVPTLLAYLREVGAMLVVVTTHGRRGLRRAVLGSITDALVRECPTAVLAVRARETADLPASTSGLEPVLVPFDGTERDADAIDLAKLVSTLIPTSLVLLHVIPPPRLPDRSPMAAIDRAELRQQHDVIGRYLAKQALDIGTPATPVSARIVPADDVADAITRAADREGARLIAMVTRGRGGASRWALGSVADRVLREGHHDVLLMRART